MPHASSEIPSDVRSDILLDEADLQTELIAMTDAWTDELLKKQPEAYHTHEPWLKDGTPELVRLAMLEVRRQEGETVAQFEAALQVAEDRLGKIEPEMIPVEAPVRRY